MSTPLLDQSIPDLSAVENNRMAWWLKARYGMFLHWGVSSIAGTELSWSRGGSKPLDITGDPVGYVEDPSYDSLYKQFNPSCFDAGEWVKTAQRAGMKYMVLTAKHHDGFCLWDTQLTDYKITGTPFKRDIVREFVEACHSAGMKVGLYYSQRDWHHPAYGVGDNRAYREYMNGQLTELLSNFGRIDVIWFDSYGKGDLRTFWGLDETWSLIRRLQPQAVINNRLAVLDGYNEQGELYSGDFDTPEQTIGKMQTHRSWESCLCLVAGQWSFKPRGEMYPLDKLVQAIVSCVTGDGNLLMNVGPMPTGEIEKRQSERLEEAGYWLRRYGESIYGTRGGPFANTSRGGSTYRGATVYVHVFDWDGTNILKLNSLPQNILAARLLTGGVVVVNQTQTGVEFKVDPIHQDPIDTIIELTLDGEVNQPLKGQSIGSLFGNSARGGLISTEATFKAYSMNGDGSARNLPMSSDPGALDKSFTLKAFRNLVLFL